MKLAKSFIEIDSESKEPAETTIKGFMPIGSVSGSGTVSVTAYEIVVPARQIAFHGVRFEVSGNDEYSSPAIATVAVENASKLIASIDQLAATTVSTERFKLFEVEAVVDDFRVVVFNTEKNQLHSAVEANGVYCHFFRQSDLYDLSKLVGLALDHLKTHGAIE